MKTLLIFTPLFLSMACAGSTHLGVRKEPPHPVSAEDVDWAEETFIGAGGLELYAQRWRRRQGEPRAVVVLHHGLADHSDRYSGFATALARAGYGVWALDMRGHARSGGPRVDVASIDLFLDDLDAFLALVRARESGQRVFLFGHSLGGLIAALYVVERQPELAGLVLSAPGIAFDAPPLQAAAIRVLGTAFPGLPVLATPHGDFSSSAEIIAEMDRDPLIYQADGTARTALAAVSGIERLWARAGELRVPLLALHGTIDKLTAPAGSQKLVERAASADKRMNLYENFNHDLLHEPNGGGERVAGDVLAWLNAHTGGAPLAEAALPQGPLKGDRGPSAMLVEIDARGELPRNEAVDPGGSAGLRLRLGFGRLGWHGGVDLRGVFLDGAHVEADLYALGTAVRLGHAGQLALTAGAGVGGVRGIKAARIPVELSFEIPAGPIHLTARATAAWRLSGPAYAEKVGGFADEAGGTLAVRLGRDRRYWADVAAGAGPFLAVSWRNLGGEEFLGAALGLQLWGLD